MKPLQTMLVLLMTAFSSNAFGVNVDAAECPNSAICATDDTPNCRYTRTYQRTDSPVQIVSAGEDVKDELGGQERDYCETDTGGTLTVEKSTSITYSLTITLAAELSASALVQTKISGSIGGTATRTDTVTVTDEVECPGRKITRGDAYVVTTRGKQVKVVSSYLCVLSAAAKPGKTCSAPATSNFDAGSRESTGSGDKPKTDGVKYSNPACPDDDDDDDDDSEV